MLYSHSHINLLGMLSVEISRMYSIQLIAIALHARDYIDYDEAVAIYPSSTLAL